MVAVFDEEDRQLTVDVCEYVAAAVTAIVSSSSSSIK